MGLDEVFPAPIERLLPSQVRYSSKNVEEKIKNALRKSYVSETADDEYMLFFNDGNSLYPPHQPLPAINVQNGFYIIIDGHHSILASQKVGATTAFINIIESTDDYPSPSFWEAMENRGLAYLRTIGGEPCPPANSFQDLCDDPVRYFASLARCKVDEKLDLSKARGATYPLWFKIGKDTPFIEFKIADHLYRHGFRVSNDELNTDDHIDYFIEKARSILQQYPLNGFRILYERAHFEESDEIKEYLRAAQHA